jgi:hypothetical protein
VRRALRVSVTENHFAALVSFAFNVGCGAAERSGAMRAVNERRWSDVAGELGKWVRGGGQVLPGLVRRRAAEAALFNDAQCDGAPPPGTRGECKAAASCRGRVVPGLCPGPSTIQCCVEDVAVPDDCVVGGQRGVCVAASSCVGVASVSSACDAPLRCCVPVPLKPPDPVDLCVVGDGRRGQCLPTSNCSAAGGQSIAGLCPGPAAVQCCVLPQPPACTANGRPGACINAAACNGTRVAVPGLCDGPTEIQCCVNRTSAPQATAVSCVADGQQGTCSEVSACAGRSVAGRCPGPSNIQCCISGGQNCTGGAREGQRLCVCARVAHHACAAVLGTRGTCLATTECRGTATPGFCPGLPSNVQCCTSRSVTSTAPSDCPDTAAVELHDAYRNGQYIGRIEVVRLQGEPERGARGLGRRADGPTGLRVERTTACAFGRMNAAFGNALRLSSGFRTMDEQRYLHNCYVTQSCNSGNLAARPGWSNHQHGIALDIRVADRPDHYAWLAANAQRFGFVRTVPSERWHWEYRPGQPRASYT